MARGNRFDYFDAMEQIVGYACEEAHQLESVVRDFDPAKQFDRMNDMHRIENSSDVINHEIYSHLATEFITPIDRDDILQLAQMLDDIVDSIEDVMIRLYMCDVQEIPEPVKEMTSLIVKSTDALQTAIKEFRHFKKSATIRKMLIEVSDCEDEADKKYIMALRHLHTRRHEDPMFVHVWESVVSMIEECCDKCAHAGDAMGTVIMKNT